MPLHISESDLPSQKSKYLQVRMSLGSTFEMASVLVNVVGARFWLSWMAGSEMMIVQDKLLKTSLEDSF